MGQNSDEGDLRLFRAMRTGPDGTPAIGPTARTLGVRPDDDIPVVAGRVETGAGGLSVAPGDAMFLPRHRRPPRFGGDGKDPIWSIAVSELGRDLAFRRDNAHHGVITPAESMTLDDFQAAIASTATFWRLS